MRTCGERLCDGETKYVCEQERKSIVSVCERDCVWARE